MNIWHDGNPQKFRPHMNHRIRFDFGNARYEGHIRNVLTDSIVVETYRKGVKYLPEATLRTFPLDWVYQAFCLECEEASRNDP